MRLKNSGNFCVEQVPWTSHVATRPKNHVRDASVPRCRGLCSRTRLQCVRVVEGVVLILASAPGPRCTVYLFSVFFFVFFCRLVLLKYTLMEIICCCLLLLYLCISLFSRFFHRQTNCMRQGSTVIVLYQKEAAQSTIYLKYKWFAYLLVHRLKTGSGRRHYPRYAHKQSTPTTKTVVRFYSSCVTLFYTLNTISSCAVVFGRIFTLTYIRMRALLWPSSNRCVPPSKG